VVAFAEGGGANPWNVGSGVCGVGAAVAAPTSQDDFGFIEEMVEDTERAQAVDRAAIFVSGFSMGGYLANHAGCALRDFVRAVAAHSAGTYGGDCAGRAIPVMLLHGDSDTLISYGCGENARDLYVERNGCESDPQRRDVKGGSCESYECPVGQEVEFCSFMGMDHGWAGAPGNGPGAWIAGPIAGPAGDAMTYGGGTDYADAAELIWAFFKRQL
jgi:polyhydroxybutyrate depolymerase